MYSPGHVMMYLGKDEGVHYMIHDFTYYGQKQGEQYIRIPICAVAVTSTLLSTPSGIPYIEKFTSIIEFES